jgi:hypothetical protein
LDGEDRTSGIHHRTHGGVSPLIIQPGALQRMGKTARTYRFVFRGLLATLRAA